MDPKTDKAWEREMEVTRKGRTKPSNLRDVPGRMPRLLPTPLASDCGEKVTGLEKQDSLVKRARSMTGETSRLNPRFVEEMMGFPPGWLEEPFRG